MAANSGVKIYDTNRANQHSTEGVVDDSPPPASLDISHIADHSTSSVTWPIRDLMFSPTCMCAK